MTSLPGFGVEPVYRPPAEAESLLIPVTIGCSHNRCSFCAMYRSKDYRVRPVTEITEDLQRAADSLARHSETCRKIFFLDGDAMAAPAEILEIAAKTAVQLFPKLRRIALYASAQNILEKEPQQLRSLSTMKLRLAYAGLESGSNDVLRLAGKGSRAEDMVAAASRLRAAGWQLSLIVMLGLGGRRLSAVHCRDSAEVISACAPDFLSFLTTTPVPGTAYQRLIDQGEIEPLSSRELLGEMRDILAGVNPIYNHRIIFRANHVSNQFPLEGILPRDRCALIQQLEQWIASCPAGHYPSLNPGRL